MTRTPDDPYEICIFGVAGAHVQTRGIAQNSTNAVPTESSEQAICQRAREVRYFRGSINDRLTAQEWLCDSVVLEISTLFRRRRLRWRTSNHVLSVESLFWLARSRGPRATARHHAQDDRRSG
jgi:hypothetical protein